MPGTLTDELEILHSGHGGGTDVPAGGDGDNSRGGLPAVPRRVYFTAVQLALAGIVMFFMALTSSFLVRKGLGNDWVSFDLPRILWANTLVLLASRVSIQMARNALSHGDRAGFRRFWALTTGLGFLFLAGQLVAWHQLAVQGVFLATNPSSSFFYLLTAAHGAHLLGGIVSLLYVSFRNWDRSRIDQPTAAALSSIYWHFMDGLWLFLFALLSLGR